MSNKATWVSNEVEDLRGEACISRHEATRVSNEVTGRVSNKATKGK